MQKRSKTLDDMIRKYSGIMSKEYEELLMNQNKIKPENSVPVLELDALSNFAEILETAKKMGHTFDDMFNLKPSYLKNNPYKTGVSAIHRNPEHTPGDGYAWMFQDENGEIQVKTNYDTSG